MDSALKIIFNTGLDNTKVIVIFMVISQVVQISSGAPNAVPYLLRCQEIQHWTWRTTMDSTHVTLEPNKMRFSGKENVQCYLSYTVVQCFSNTFTGCGSSSNHNKTESVQAIWERRFPVFSFLHFPCTMLSKNICLAKV